MSEALNLEPEKKVREPFVVDCDMKAEWCLKKIREIRAKQKEEKAELERQMKFYEDQMDFIDKEADDDVLFFESMLRPYFNSRVSDGFTKATKTKVSYKLPNGELKLNHRDPEYEYKKNQAETIKFLKDSKIDGFIKTTEELKWKDFKDTLSKDENGKIRTITDENGILRVVMKDGEIVPGITVTEREDEFKVEVN